MNATIDQSMQQSVAPQQPQVSAGKWDLTFRFAGIAAAIAGVTFAYRVVPGSVTYDAAPVGVAVFAVLFVIASGVERVIEWVTELLKLIGDSPGEKRTEALRNLTKPDSDAAQQKDAKQLTTSTTSVKFLAHGLAILLAVIVVNRLNYGVLGYLGANGVPMQLDHLLTALAAAGGSKAVHELVANLEKRKEAAAQTGASS